MAFTEPTIVVNGVHLTDAQAMAVRVAITSYHAEMSDETACGDDDQGRLMTRAYHDRLSEVLNIIVK